MKDRQREIDAFVRLLDVMDTLREKCPWDSKQTMESIRPNTIEETYELCEAIVNHDMPNIKKELGDVLLHVVFYSKIASETKDFDIADVCNALCDKLIFRHPHIYGDQSASSSQQVEQTWEQIKLKEKDGNKTVLSGVPSTLPALIKAYRIQDKARNVGFKWQTAEQAWAKVREEFGELMDEIDRLDEQKQEQEFGDLLFAMINAARIYKINPDNALEYTNQKFIRRFTYLENKTIRQGRNLKDMSTDEMMEIWNEAKTLERDGKL